MPGGAGPRLITGQAFPLSCCRPSAGQAASPIQPISDENAAVRELPRLQELQLDLAGHRMKQRDTRAQQQRMDIQANLVNQAGLEQRPGQVSATDETDALA